jgi:hypothetical protein
MGVWESLGSAIFFKMIIEINSLTFESLIARQDMRLLYRRLRRIYQG